MGGAVWIGFDQERKSSGLWSVHWQTVDMYHLGIRRVSLRQGEFHHCCRPRLISFEKL